MTRRPKAAAVATTLLVWCIAGLALWLASTAAPAAAAHSLQIYSVVWGSMGASLGVCANLIYTSRMKHMWFARVPGIVRPRPWAEGLVLSVLLYLSTGFLMLRWLPRGTLPIVAAATAFILVSAFLAFTLSRILLFRLLRDIWRSL